MRLSSLTMGYVLTIAGLALALYLLLALGMYFGQRQFMYFPDERAPDRSAVPLRGIETVETVTADGLRLRHWYRQGIEDAPVVVVFHGNAGNIEGRAFKFRRLAEAGFGLFLAEYRGYGGNPGTPSETGLLKDARSVMDWLTERGVSAHGVALYGESLGTGVAVAIAAEREVGAVVLESAFTSAAELAQAHYWYLPARWLVRDRFDSRARIGGIEAPLLILQGSEDTIVPPRFGEQLHAAASEPKALQVIEGADHLDIWQRGGEAATLDFLNERLQSQDRRVLSR